jgi:hypothetical protein
MSRETPSIPRCDSHLRRRVFALSTRYRGYKEMLINSVNLDTRDGERCSC